MSAPARDLTRTEQAVARDAADASAGALAPPALEGILARLLSRSFLYDHPSDYREGVTATIAALRDASHRIAHERTRAP